MFKYLVGLFVVAFGACEFPDTGDIAPVGGTVRGLWDGSDGVTLRLQAGAVDTLLTVPANGTFRFLPAPVIGVPYTVTVANNPVAHACVVDAGSQGTIADATATAVSVACTGPASIGISGSWGWTFDPTQDVQTFAGSIATQQVSLNISGAHLTGATVAGADVILGAGTAAIALPLGQTSVPVQLTAEGGLAKQYQLVFDRGSAVLDQLAYGKASNTDAGDAFGFSVALSGNTLAVAAPGESSGATGVNGFQADNRALLSGAVYVFVREGTTWAQQAYLKASNTGVRDAFGFAVALSGDTLAVSALGESSRATTIDGDQTDDSALNAGAVYVFVRNGTAWTQQAYVKASNASTLDGFGFSLALSGDTLAVGASTEDSNATGVNGDQENDDATDAGAAYVFVRDGETWSEQAYLKASNTEAGDHFGLSLTLSGDSLAVGAPREGSNASGVNGDQSNNSAPGSGAVYLFTRTGTSWSQEAYIKASNPGADDEFGSAIALSGDTLAVGAHLEDSKATGVNGNQADNSATDAGAIYVFSRTGTRWSQQAYLKGSNTEAKDQFGATLALSGDTLAVGALGESSNAIGVNGNQADNNAPASGAVYVFVRSQTAWTQQAYVKASNTNTGDLFGSLALSDDTLVVGACNEASSATGLQGNQGINGFSFAGAAYIFR